MYRRSAGATWTSRASYDHLGDARRVGHRPDVVERLPGAWLDEDLGLDLGASGSRSTAGA